MAATPLEARLDMSLDDILKHPKLEPGGKGIVVAKRCYVGNLSYRTSWQDLKDHFRQIGNVVYSKVLDDPSTGGSKGCGIVEFETPSQAARAIAELHDKELAGRKLIVREDRDDFELKSVAGGVKGSKGKGAAKSDSRGSGNSFGDAKRSRTSGSFEHTAASYGAGVESRRCYVGNLTYRTSWQDLKDHFKQVGKVVYTGIMEESPGRSKGCGIVEFETVQEAAKAIQMLHDSDLKGRQIFVREDREDRELKQASSTATWKPTGNGKGAAAARAAYPAGSRRVYVGNLTYRTSWQDLKDHFKRIGKVVYSNIMEESGTGRSKGCGIVEFESAADAARAIEALHDSILNGRQIFVREDREDRELSGR